MPPGSVPAPSGGALLTRALGEDRLYTTVRAVISDACETCKACRCVSCGYALTLLRQALRQAVLHIPSHMPTCHLC